MAPVAEPKWKTAFYASLIVFECLVWGIGNPLLKLGANTITPFYLLSVRFVIAFLIFLFIYLFRLFIVRYRERSGDFSWRALGDPGGAQDSAKKRAILGVTRKTLPKLLITGLLTGGAFLIGNLALVLTEATIAGFLLSLSVLTTPFLSYFMLKTRVRPVYYVIIAVVVAGMYLLCWSGGGFRFGAGEACALGASLLFGISLTYVSKYGRELQLDPFAVSFFQVGASAVLSVISALLFEDYHVLANMTWPVFGIIIYLVIFCTCMTYLLQNIALAHISAVFVSVAFCSESVFTALFSYLILGERLTALGFFGAALITVGVVAASLIGESGKSFRLRGKTRAPGAPE